MAIYLVSYDLLKESTSAAYQPLWDELKRLGACKTQYSLWLVDLDNTPQQIVEHFKRFVDSNDRIWASRLTKEHWYTNAIGGSNEWLNKHPPT